MLCSCPALRPHFNSRPSARGDRAEQCLIKLACYFNSRPSARGDRQSSQRPHKSRQISIHAPPRGATCWEHTIHFTPRENFNSRPSARGDRRKPSGSREPADFNSRPSARGDVAECARTGIDLFQFTPLREGRLPESKSEVARNISIHAPPRGATVSSVLHSDGRNISIHAPPRGATIP